MENKERKLSPEMAEIIKHLEYLNNQPMESLDAQAARNQAEFKDAVNLMMNSHFTKRALGILEPVTKLKHHTIKGPDGNDLMMRIYYPEESVEMLPACLYFHGGGMVVKNINSYDSSCRAICNTVKCIVISVGYRQAPENPFPAAINDAYAAYTWLLEHGGSIGVNTKKVAVVGECSGGNLAAAVCIKAAQENVEQPVHQVLVYPMLDYNFTTPSYQEFELSTPLNKAIMKWCWDHYLSNPEQDQHSPLACPLRAKSLEGLAPATIILAEIDPLFSEGVEYARKLEDHNVDVVVSIFYGVIHEFFTMTSLIPQAREALEVVSGRLIEAFMDKDEIPLNPEAETFEKTTLPYAFYPYM
jgi:acetyl esterase